MTNESPKVRLVIVDDHEVVRSGLRANFQQSGHIDLVGEAKDGEEGLALILELKPDVALVDLNMPKMGGLQLIRELRRLGDRPYAIVLSFYDDLERIPGAINAGARGYLDKGANKERILAAIERVARGETCFPPCPLDLSTQLSPQEKQVAILIAKGFTTDGIAEQMTRIGTGEQQGISPRTVETYRQNIKRKWQVSTTAEIVHEVILRGWHEDGS
jgi:DNA-binding NarL/FixJ family response regulator